MAGGRRFLLTGATGFVGRQVLRELHERRCETRLIVRNEAALPPFGTIERVISTRDLWDESSASLAEACRDIDTVIHAAWYAEPGQYLQSAKNFECLAGTLRLAEAAVQSGVRRFVGIGTCFEYDLSAGDLPIETKLAPLTPYALAKVATFTSLSQALPQRGVEFLWCRAFYLHGEGEDERRFVPYLRGRLAAGEAAELTSGTQVRDYLDVREAGRMIADAALGLSLIHI